MQLMNVFSPQKTKIELKAWLLFNKNGFYANKRSIVASAEFFRKGEEL